MRRQAAQQVPKEEELQVRHARLLLKALSDLWQARTPSHDSEAEPTLSSMIAAVEAAAQRRHQTEARLWLQRLEEIAYGAWQQVAREEGADRRKAA